MFCSVVALVFSDLLDLSNLRRLSYQEKELEILILRNQLDILERKQTPYSAKTSSRQNIVPFLCSNLA
jgi:hypothetical protein